MAKAASKNGKMRASKRALPGRSNQSFRFLGLPAEIRNAIYQSCVDDTQTRGVEYLHRSPSPRDGSASRQYFELTQVCSQIRTEFRPMYMTSVLKQIWLENLANYLKVFHTDAQVADNMVVDLLGLATKSAAECNLLKLFFHLAKHPQITCAFSSSVQVRRRTSLFNLGTILTRGAKQVHDPGWNQAARQVLAIIPKRSTMNLIVVVKLAVKVALGLKLRTLEIKQFESDLRNKLGLHAEGNWSVVIKYDAWI